MEKLSFFGSLGKSISLYFKYFGKFFNAFLIPYFIMLAGYLLIAIPIFGTIFLNNILIKIIAIVLAILGVFVFIRGFSTMIMLQPATAIISKKLFENGEVPDYKEALQEVRDDGWRLFRLILWYLLFSLTLAFAFALPTSIIATIIFGKLASVASGIIGQFICIFIYSFMLFVFQFFALKKDISALECITKSFKMASDHILPIFFVFFGWFVICLVFGIAMGALSLTLTPNLIASPLVIVFPILFIIFSIFLFITISAISFILTTYWYLRFSEEENA